MILRYHEFERVLILINNAIVLDAREATLNLDDGFLAVSARSRNAGGYENRWGCLGEVVSWTPWWAELRVRASLQGSDDLQPGNLYAVVYADGIIPAHWPEEMKRSLHVA